MRDKCKNKMYIKQHYITGLQYEIQEVRLIFDSEKMTNDM